MSYARRQINLAFSDPKGNTLFLPGLRCAVVVTNPGGYASAGQMQLRVYGMTLDQMNQFSSTGTDMVALQQLYVTVLAGNEGSVIAQIFQGSIFRAFPDFSGAPEVAFVCSAVAGLYEQGTPSAPNSYPGAANAEDMIKALAGAIGFKFTNNGAHQVLRNHYLSGSIVDQIRDIAKAAAFACVIENQTVSIWPRTGTRDGNVINLGPGNGLVGYPSYWEAGFVVKSEFNPNIVNGRQIALTSSIPKANGTWPIQTVTHEISTMTPNGPWFTNIKLSPAPYVPAN